MEQHLCLLPFLGGRDADESDWTRTPGSPGCGEWSLLISVGEAGDRPQVPVSYRDPDLWGANLQAMWYTKDRAQVGSVVEELASWDGIGIYFDSSTSDVQVGSHLLLILLPACLNPHYLHSACGSDLLSPPTQDSPVIRVLASDGHDLQEQSG